MQEPEPASGTKAALRASLLERRSVRSDDDRVAVAEAICAHLAGAPFAQVPTIAAYLSMGSEPGTGPLIELLLGRGAEVIVPVTTDGALDWVRYDPEARLTRSPLGVAEPEGPRLGADALDRAGLIIAPALAVDHAGWRLGRGAGYFDRALAHARGGGTSRWHAGSGQRGTICALVYADELLPTLPHEDHDVPVDVVVTEAGIFRVPAPPTP